MSFRLYGYWRSSSAYRVRIVLGYKGIEFKPSPIHLLKGEHSTEPFRRLSPMEQLPVLQHELNGELRTLTQSVAIMEYLEALRPEPSLLPSDPWARALVRERVEVINSGIQPLQNMRVQSGLKAAGVQDSKTWSKEQVQRGLLALEAMVSSTKGKYCVGEDVTLADVALVPQLYAARRLAVQTAPLSALLEVEAECQKLEAFLRAHPDQQPDASIETHPDRGP